MRMKINDKYIAMDGGSLFWIPKLPPSVLTPERIWKKAREQFLQKKVLLHELSGSSDHMARARHHMVCRHTSAQAWANSSGNLMQLSASGAYGASVYPVRSSLLSGLENARPVGFAYEITTPAGYRSVCTQTPLGILRRIHPDAVHPDLASCRRALTPRTMSEFRSRWSSVRRTALLFQCKTGGYYVAFCSRPSLEKHRVQWLPEFSLDGNHCFACTRREWFEQLEAFAWGRRAMEAARVLLRKLAVLGSEYQIQMIPPVESYSSASAVILVTWMKNHEIQFARLRILPDRVTQVPISLDHTAKIPARCVGFSLSPLGAQCHAPYVLGMNASTDIRSVPRPTPGTRCVAVDFVESGSDDRSNCVRTQPLELSLRHDSGRTHRYSWLTTVDEAAGAVLMRLLTSGLPAA